MIVLLLKVTLLLALPLAILPLLQRSSAAIRHVICASALAGALPLPLTQFAPRPMTLKIAALSVIANPSTTVNHATWPPSRIALTFWAAISLLLLLRIAVGYLTLARLLRKATPLGLTFPAPAYYADISVPVAAGLFRPVILLPRDAQHWPQSRRDAALNHELRHIGRKDLQTLAIAHLATAIYWFHPLAWLVAKRLREEQESACDDAVLASGFDAASYAEALVATARQLTSTSLIGCHMLTTTTLKSRIARLFDNGLSRIPSRTGLRAAAAIAVVSIAFVGLLAANDQVYKVGPNVQAPRILSKIDPEYTPEAKAEKLSGTVALQMVIDTSGRAKDIEVIRGIGSGLDEKAVEAIQQWFFQPGMKDGEPVQVRVNIEVNFRLF